MYFRVENIKKRFENEKGISDISFDLDKGELVSFLGPSGCGKTTLLNVIGGFLTSDNGKIYLEDKEITNIPPEKRNISTVFQDYALFPHMSVIENIGYGLKYRNKNRKEQKELASKYLEIVGLKGYEKSSIHELSGGQQQRVALARALVLSPKILLLDEPFSNLDAKLKINMREELKALQKRLGITMIFVTHDQEEALSISDKIVIMRDGIIEQIGTPEEIYYKPANEYVADFIGKVNFISENSDKKIVRPEDIKMEHMDNGKWRIVSKEFMGSHTFFIVTDEKTDICVSIYGEKSREFKIGDRVNIEI